MERLSESFDRFELLFKNKQILEILGNLSNIGPLPICLLVSSS